MEGDLSCGGLQKEMELVVWKRRWSWWSGKGDGVGGVKFMVKDEMHENVVEVRMVSDRVMTAVVFEDDCRCWLVGMVRKVEENIGKTLQENSLFMSS